MNTTITMNHEPLELYPVENNNEVDIGAVALAAADVVNPNPILDDPDLTALSVRGTGIRYAELDWYRRIQTTQLEINSYSTRFQFEVTNAFRGNFSDMSRRVATYVWSKEFVNHWEDRNYRLIILNLLRIVQRAIMYEAFATCVKEALETLFESLQWDGTAANAALAVLMVVGGCSFQCREIRTNAGVTVTKEILKTVVVLTKDWYVSVPLCSFIEDFANTYNVLSLRCPERNWAQNISPAVWGAVHSMPFIGAYLRPAPLDVPTDMYLDADVHDAFACTITWGPAVDPVWLHGNLFSRKAITRWLDISSTHPFTRKAASAAQLIEPTAEFMIAYRQYFAERAQIIAAQQQDQQAQLE
jgi:hypothetical protein